ncbi:MAG: septum formation family protein [Acidimicrobiia bacterium]|nr:septum formation family protein [Acidimicrobiia bacterium]
MMFRKYASQRRAGTMLTVFCALIALSVAGCGLSGGGAGDDGSTRDASGVIIEGGSVGVNVLQLGDCFNDSAAGDGADITSVDAVPCPVPHDNEVYYLGALPETEFPGESMVEELVSDQCLTVFEAFAGIGYAESQLEISYIYPSEGSWNSGDRGYICTVYDVSLSKLEGSMRGRGY